MQSEYCIENVACYTKKPKKRKYGFHKYISKKKKIHYHYQKTKKIHFSEFDKTGNLREVTFSFGLQAVIFMKKVSILNVCKWKHFEHAIKNVIK